MSERTSFVGLEVLAPGEPLSSDGYRFQAINPRIIDRVLQLGAVGHKHDAHAAVANPSEAPVVTTAAAGGTIPAEATLHVAFTWVDEEGGETLASPPEAVTTRAGLEAPTGAPTLAVSYAAGTLLAGNYDYALTVTDGAGGETEIGPSESIVVEPGHEHAEVTISNLKALREEVGGATHRLWRRFNGSVWYLIDESEGDEVLDNGTLAGDCTVQPPNSTTAHGTSTITVTVGEAAPARTVSFNLYVSEDGSFPSPCFVANYPLSEIGKAIELTALELNNGEPPLVSLSIPGATKIDPDTDMVAWPWKQPVANAAALPAEGNENGDVRETLNDHALHSWDAESKTWVEITGGGGGGGGHQILNPAGEGMAAEPKLQFIGTPVTVTDDAEHNRTIVTIASGSPIDYKGAWLVGTTYAVDAVVTRGGGSYLAIAETTGNDPSTDEGVHWGILAAPGAKGEGGGGGGALEWRGAWSNVTTYAVDDAVSFAGGSYVSIVAENLGHKPDTHPEDWAILALPGVGLIPSGPWLVGTTYTTGDLVQRNGSAYVSKKEGNTGNDPALDAEEINWMLLVQKGAPGEVGPPGSGMSWKGSWASGTTYKVGDGVLRNGSGYIGVAEANKGNDPSTDGGAHWQLFASIGAEGKAGPKGSAGLRYRGAYSGAVYQQYDVVKSGGKYYVSYKSGTQSGHEPPNATYWELFHGEGPSESKVWVMREVEPGTLPGVTTRINRSEARQQIVGLDLHIGKGECDVTVKENGGAIAHLNGVKVKDTGGVYIDLTALKEAGEEGKFFPYELADGGYITVEVSSVEGSSPEEDLSVTLHIEHVIWGDV